MNTVSMMQHNNRTNNISMLERQQPLLERYKTLPEVAVVIDHGSTQSSATPTTNPLHTDLSLCKENPTPLKVGVHTAVGGDSDFPTPGDILCGALAACLDSTLRIIANRLGVPLLTLEVDVKGSVDVRGTLRVDDQVETGFTSFDIDVKVEVPPAVNPAIIKQLIKGAEQSCIVLQTLRNPPVTNITSHIC